MESKYILVILFLLGAASVTIVLRKLTVAGALTGALVGLFIFSGAGYPGLLMIASFFILGTAATSWKLKWKEQSGLAEKNKGRRTAGQVIANSGVAGMLGLLAFLFPEKSELFMLMMAGAFASATADTLSSELGVVYGKNTYNVLSFKPDIRGSNGVISIQGTLIGMAGSMIIAIIYAAAFGWNRWLLIIVAAGTIGNLSDSVLGATLERKQILSNNIVNFINTLVAAITILVFFV